jgi:hypothetical protein
LTWLPVRNGVVSYLTTVDGGAPEIVAHEPASADIVLAVEPIASQRQRYLAVRRRRGNGGTLNGLPAPRAGILRIADQLRLGDAYVLHVSLRSQPYIGPAREQDIGQMCQFCGTPILAGQQVYVCPHCDSPLHCQGEETPESERLSCAQLATECRVCGKPIVAETSYAYTPEV